jgi:hypothetical protein
VRVVIEIMTFRLRPDVVAGDFLALDGRVQTEVAYQCDGLLRRTTARDDDRWLVLQIWATPEACLAAAPVLEASTLGRQFMALIDRATLTVERFGPAA